MSSPDISVDLGFMRLSSPVIGASGIFGVETARVLPGGVFGAIVTKTQFEGLRPGNPINRIVETPAGLMNSVGIPCLGLDHFVAEEWPRWQAAGCPIIVSVGGETAAEYVRVAERLNSLDGVAAIEVNISCPNQAAGGLEFGATARDVEQVVSDVVRVSRYPVIAKLTPNVTRIADIAAASEQAGARAITAINTVVAMSLDIRRRRSRLGTLKGGLSGPAMRPIAVRAVWEVAQAVRIPVIGSGGAETAEDILEFVLAGASAVALGTAAFFSMEQFRRLEGELRDLLTELGLKTVSEFRGALSQDDSIRNYAVTAG
jgi:dihydroorotate dehydrogenase (NAD+) catalytic subunit